MKTGLAGVGVGWGGAVQGWVVVSMMGVGLRSSGDRGNCVQTPESPGTCCGRADGEAQPLKVEVQGQANEAVLAEEMPAALGEEDRKREVGLEGSWPREEGGWWSGVNPDRKSVV